ncbi:uncharacterized protein LOC100650343 isoform X1 [Bombus terrestris]|uniref:Uncharacterized protein LOC100650343 isoform X1 n=1 Tax=Bombus terrestris TaxID=30195 RepID=A0A9B0C1M1_BOMTE|nr:uncharacterized protein LOC100650343 isoform X1 [Bombus terrestris]
MNTVTIVLLLSMCFCALCGATPVSSLDQVELIPSNCTNETATQLQRVTRQSPSINFVEGIGSDILRIPTNLLATIISFILSIIDGIKSTFLSWIGNIESFLQNPLTLLNNNQNSNQRRRRSNVSNGLSDLISDLPNLLNLPVSYFQQATSSVGDSVVSKVQYVIKAVIRFVWNFVITKVLPWLDDVLTRVKQSNTLPSFLNDAIGDANFVYSLLRLFTGITSNSS